MKKHQRGKKDSSSGNRRQDRVRRESKRRKSRTGGYDESGKNPPPPGILKRQRIQREENAKISPESASMWGYSNLSLYTPRNDPTRGLPAAGAAQKRGAKSSCGNLPQKRNSRKIRPKTACVNPTQDPVSSHKKRTRSGKQRRSEDVHKKMQAKTQGSQSKSSLTHQGELSIIILNLQGISV